MGKPGRPPKHGAYSLIVRDELIRDRPALRHYLESTREGLIADLAGKEESLTTAQAVLIDRVIGKLGILRLIEEHVRAKGIIGIHNGHIQRCKRRDFARRYSRTFR